LFYGKIRQRLTGIDIQHSRSSIHEKEDLFSHLPVNVTNDGVDVYDGLSGYFDDVVEFDGKKVRMEMSLVELPPILQIQLQVGHFSFIEFTCSECMCILARPIQPRNTSTI